eukprot:TRINITY_DN39979_c0_g1_i1.p1 TRINITY_DN39979_c0_g1~~TRINITY_DN39979_c0_g1_i1.p1  ORF type:complete len:228 (+),score=34.02 TRINITY_DN39979_c0_g1_i1:57-740(+)
MASISCACAKTKVTFPTKKPCWAVDCFCVDCYQKNAHFAQISGTSVPDTLTVQGMGKPMLLNYFPAKMVVTGEENLTFNKLRDDSHSVNCCAKCCGSLLFVDNPGYQKQIVLMMPEFRPIEDGEKMLAVGRVHIQDWPEEAYKKYEESAKPLPSMRLVHKDNNTTRVLQGAFTPSISDAIKEATNISATVAEGKTFEELLAGTGGNIEVLGIAEMPNSARSQQKSVR